MSGVERYYVRGVTWRMDVGQVTTPCDCSDPCVEVVLAEAYDQLSRRVAELEGALQRLEVSANTVARCYTHRPEHFASALSALARDAEAARAALKGQG